MINLSAVRHSGQFNFRDKMSCGFKYDDFFRFTVRINFSFRFLAEKS